MQFKEEREAEEEEEDDEEEERLRLCVELNNGLHDTIIDRSYRYWGIVRA